MLKKLTTDQTDVLDESTMKEATGSGPTSCLAWFLDIAHDCYTHGGQALATHLYEEQRVSSGGWL